MMRVLLWWSVLLCAYECVSASTTHRALFSERANKLNTVTLSFQQQLWTLHRILEFYMYSKRYRHLHLRAKARARPREKKNEHAESLLFLYLLSSLRSHTDIQFSMWMKVLRECLFKFNHTVFFGVSIRIDFWFSIFRKKGRVQFRHTFSYLI